MADTYTYECTECGDTVTVACEPAGELCPDCSPLEIDYTVDAE